MKQSPPDREQVFERPLPANLDAERYCLAACLTSKQHLADIIEILSVEEFSSVKHQTIFRHIKDLGMSGVVVDRVTLSSSLMNHGELESVDGVSYIISLDEGMPALVNARAYAEIVKEKARLRQLIILNYDSIQRAQDGFASSEVIKALNDRLFSSFRSTEPSPTRSLAEIGLRLGEQRLNPTYTPPGKTNRIVFTGYDRLDKLTGGMRGGLPWLCGARPSTGKSAILCQVARYNARRKVGCLLFSMDTEERGLYGRLLCQEAEVPYIRYLNNELSDIQKQALREADYALHQMPIWVNNTRNLTAAKLRQEARRKMDECEQLGLLGIDYIQQMVGSNTRLTPREQLNQVCEDIKTVLFEEDLAGLILAQLGRDFLRMGGRKPTLEHLKESGKLEEFAEVAFFPWREELIKRTDSNRGKAEFLLRKNKPGKTEEIPMEWIGWKMKYKDVDREPSYLDDDD